MSTYNVACERATVAGKPADLFRVGFGLPGQNTDIVRDAEGALRALGELGGGIALVNGPASLPAAVVLAHHLLHRYAVLGVFDPKMGGYVVASAHGGEFVVGDLIPATDVIAV